MNRKNIIKKWKNLKIMVIGDAMLDIYLNGESNRICREAPVPIVTIKQKYEAPGGAGNTAVNIADLGAQTYFVSVIGSDTEGKTILHLLQKHHIRTQYLAVDQKRKTITKERISADTQLLVRFDKGSTQSITEKAEKEIITNITALYPHMDAILISDYGYGTITEKIKKTVQDLQQKYSPLLVIDAKNLLAYKDLKPTLIKPNYEEAIQLLGLKHANTTKNRITQIEKVGHRLRSITNTTIAAVTLDIDGALIFDGQKKPYRTFANPQENTKVAGAGDTYISAFTLALAAKAPLTEAAELASTAAEVVVQKEGTASCTPKEVLPALPQEKKVIRTKKECKELIAKLKKQRKHIVFTNGCFDILHTGHVTYLSKAKQLGTTLIVGVNSDTSVKRLKGPERPINTFDDRASVLASLASVDYVIPFTQNTPIELLKIIQPDVYVKGGDYTRETLPETPVVEKYGGIVSIIPYVLDRSTTNLIKRIRSLEKKKQSKKYTDFQEGLYEEEE